MGEIDLIMQADDYLVFIEVRARRSAAFGGAIESITALKRRKIVNTAAAYIQRYRLQEQYMIRFDVVVLQGQPPKIEWIPNAFGADF
jgi:putative endonuclease